MAFIDSYSLEVRQTPASRARFFRLSIFLATEAHVEAPAGLMDRVAKYGHGGLQCLTVPLDMSGLETHQDWSLEGHQPASHVLYIDLLLIYCLGKNGSDNLFYARLWCKITNCIHIYR